MGYCFMTIEKFKNNADFVRKYEHNYRIEKVPNADEMLLSENEELVSLHGKDYLEAYKEKIAKSDYYNGKKPRKVRSDAVKAMEVICTFSREEREHIDLEQWKKDNVKWLEETFNRRADKYGNNVVSVVYHGDEAGNVHLHAIVIPMDERGALNAKSFTDGRSAMGKLQDSYAKAMAAHNLERGLKGSMAKHKDIKKFYAGMNQSMEIEAPDLKKGESFDEYQERVTELLRQQGAKQYGQKLKYERKIDEIKTVNRETLTKTRKEMHQLEREKHAIEKKYEHFENEHGSLKEASSKLKTLDLLNEGLVNHMDQDFARGVRKNMQVIIDEEKKRRKEQLAKEQKEQETKTQDMIKKSNKNNTVNKKKTERS